MAGSRPTPRQTHRQRARRRAPHHKTRNQRRRHAAGSIDEEPDEQAEEEARVTALLDQSQATETTPTSAPVLLQAAAATDKSINLDARDRPEAKKAQLDTLLAKAEQYSQFIVNPTSGGRAEQEEAEDGPRGRGGEDEEGKSAGRPAQGHDRGDPEALPGRGVAVAGDVVRERAVWHLGRRDGPRQDDPGHRFSGPCAREERQGPDLHRGAARDARPASSQLAAPSESPLDEKSASRDLDADARRRPKTAAIPTRHTQLQLDERVPRGRPAPALKARSSTARTCARRPAQDPAERRRLPGHCYKL